MKDRIQHKRVDPVKFGEWTSTSEIEWDKPISTGDGLKKAVEIAEKAVRRSKLKRIAVKVLNVAISVTARVTKIDEINHLQIKIEDDMKRIKPFIQQKSTWEGITAILGAVGIVIYPDAIMEIVAGVFAVIGGIELWKKESKEE